MEVTPNYVLDLRPKKVSIFMANYNKNSCLPNTLESLDRQITSFEVEVCAIDDCSDYDPEDIFKTYLRTKELKYKRLPEREGTRKSMSKCLELMDPNTEVIVCQSVDVMYGSEHLLERMCSLVATNLVVMPEVRNLTIPEGLHANFDLTPYLAEEAMHSEKFTDGDFLFYAGMRQPSPTRRWYMFLAALKKEDLLRTCFPTNCFDKDVSDSLHRLNFDCVYLHPIDDMIGIHQRHSRAGKGFLPNGLYDK